ncbi:hypothetical protein VTK73DRAFT_6810 [Phialemonium thermophilum]|uniref:Hydrophobin n=1 Tax=Phialemonium thermophilum TaxID=223376 RepID=A0ABR3Y876_9PEZI
MLNFSALFSRTLFLVLLLPLLGTHASPAPNPDPSPVPGLLPKIPILDALLALGASPPPPILRTTHPSPECASINQGELLCCRATVAGDIQLVVWLAELYGHHSSLCGVTTTPEDQGCTISVFDSWDPWIRGCLAEAIMTWDEKLDRRKVTWT